jgi:hypothetical protein
VQILSSRFRNLFLTYLQKAFEEGRLGFHGQMASLNRSVAFDALCRRARRIKWVVFAKPPFGGPGQVLKYLARYTHRVAISSSRLVSMEGGCVSFRWKDYADGNQCKEMKLDAVEFIRRFLLHVLPSGFVRIRQFGFLANRARGKQLALCRSLLGALPAPAEQHIKVRSEDRRNEQDRKRCPACGVGHMVRLAIVPSARENSLPQRLDSS